MNVNQHNAWLLAAKAMIDIYTSRKINEREKESALFPRSLEGGGSDVIELTPAQPGGEPKYFKSIKK